MNSEQSTEKNRHGEAYRKGRQMKNRIDDKQLLQLVRNGNTIISIARKMGVNRSSVSRRLKTLKIAINRNVTIRAAHKIVDREIDALDQLRKINRDANEILDLLMRWNRGDEEALQVLESQVRKIRVRGREEEITQYKSKDPRELALMAMQEIREQLKLHLEMFQALFDMRGVQEFQTEVLEVIGSVSPEARDEIIRRLTEKSALRSAVDFNGTVSGEAGSRKQEAEEFLVTGCQFLVTQNSKPKTQNFSKQEAGSGKQ